MNRKNANHPGYRKVMLCIFILLVLMVACAQGTQVVEVGDFNVKRDLNNAWATLTDLNQFNQLNNSDWQDIILSGLVTTDNVGQAELCPFSSIDGSGVCSATEACHIYVFWDSTIKYSSCPESSSNAVCNYDGTQAFRNCDVTVQTLSADVQGLGTWFSVTYLRESQITLVILGEGAATVTPVDVLNFVPIEKSALIPGEVPPLMDYQINERVMGKPQTARIDTVAGETQAFFTAPAAKLQELGLTGFPSNQWLGMEGLNILRQRLHLEEPNLEPWLRSIWELAPEDAVKLPPLDPLPPENMGLVVTGYETIADARFGEVLGYSLNWPGLVKEFLQRDTPAAFNGATQFKGQFNLIGDMRDIGYDPQKAMQLVKEAGYDRFSLMLLVPPDDALLAMAKTIIPSLSRIGFQVEFIPVPESEINIEAQSLLEQGAQVLVMIQG